MPTPPRPRRVARRRARLRRSPPLAAAGYSTVADWLKLPEGRPQLGNMHGDIAVSSDGEVYVSVQDPAAGLQVYAPDGKFLRNVPDAPSDFHGFVIRKQPDGEFIYGATLRGQTIVKLRLDGGIVMTIGSAAIPDQFKASNARSGQLALLLTGLDVAPNGDIYVTDGYASDFIHRFDKTGKYLSSFGGKSRPTASTRCTSSRSTRASSRRASSRVDRANNRVVHLSLDRRVPRRRREGSAAAGGRPHQRRQRDRRRAQRPRDSPRQGRQGRRACRREHRAGRRHQQAPRPRSGARASCCRRTAWPSTRRATSSSPSSTRSAACTASIAQ